jgi:hypothetical protein
MGKKAQRRSIRVDGKKYDGVRSIIKEVIKKAGLKSYTYEDIIFAADGNLAKFAPYLTDNNVTKSLGAMPNRKVIKRCGNKGRLAFYCMSESAEKQLSASKTNMPEEKTIPQSTKTRISRYIETMNRRNNALVSKTSMPEEKTIPQPLPASANPEISAEEFGDRLIRYIVILKHKNNTLQSELSDERHLHEKALEALKEKHNLCSALERQNKELSEWQFSEDIFVDGKEDESQRQFHSIVITALTDQIGRLQIVWRYNTKSYSVASIEDLAERFGDALLVNSTRQ